MKKFLLAGVLILAITYYPALSGVMVSAECFAPIQAESQRNKEELIITLLTPEIEKAIMDYYGEYRRFEVGDSKVEIFQRGEGQNFNIFKVAVKVDTFEGPHDNYFTEFLIFTITPSGTALDYYQHGEFVPNQ